MSEQHLADVMHDLWVIKSSKSCATLSFYLLLLCFFNLFFPLAPTPYFIHLFIYFYGRLDEPKTPGRQNSLTVELLSGGRKLQSCTNNVPLNILDTIYF